ncbi:MAG: DJ-1/PfpI family protein [Treponema sp.]|nr:DJ-1/PfpI family protein [Treponema sp.]
MTKKVLIFLAEGFEEVEAITPIDYLRRAGIDVITAALGASLNVEGSHQIKISADTCIKDLLSSSGLKPEHWDAVILPGGLPGSDNLAAYIELGAFLKAMAEAGKMVCAICAAPARVLYPLGLLDGKKFSCFPGEDLKVLSGKRTEDRVTIDGNIITSRGAGTAGEFACAIISALIGEGEGEKIAERVLLMQN